MPTDVVSSIQASGGDYSTVSAWEADTDTDLVTVDERQIGEMANEAFDENVNFVGATTDSTRYRILRPQSGAYHNGTFGTGARLTTSSPPSNSPHNIDEDYFRLRFIEISPSGAHERTIDFGGSSIDKPQVVGCLVDCRQADTSGLESSAGADGEIHSNIFIGDTSTTNRGVITASDNCYNNTIAYCLTYGINDFGSPDIRNNFCFGNGTDYEGEVDGGNASEDNTGNVTNVSPSTELINDSSDPAIANYHIDNAHSVDLLNGGENLSGTFAEVDIDNESRPSVWDIGADEYIGTIWTKTDTETEESWTTTDTGATESWITTDTGAAESWTTTDTGTAESWVTTDTGAAESWTTTAN